MGPSFATCYPPSIFICYRHELGYLFASGSVLIKLQNFKNLIFRKLAQWMSDSFSILPSSFFYRILSIIFRSSKKQMVRIAAKWRITFMANKHVFWNGTTFQFEYQTMRPPVIFSVKVISIPTLYRASPKPAIIWSSNVDIGPKSLKLRYPRKRSWIIYLFQRFQQKSFYVKMFTTSTA